MADDSIRIEYNRGLKPLEELLEGVERAGDFCVSGAVEIPMPKVEVTGVGVLSFPVPEMQIRQLLQQATRAPYGRGEQTILDESVRKVWQLPPDQVRISGKSWAASFENILKQVIAGLGCEGMAVSAELYKLLVYDAGGFFKAHRDTEKAGGMFGTLVVVLPSAHRGGELVIRHAGRETVVDMGRSEISEVSFAAFYADCEHKVRPITEGNRVCLVYNLIQQPSAKNKKGVLHAPDYEKQIAAAAKLLEKNLSAPGAPAKIAWLLEHQYSPDGLSFAGLKSADAGRAKVLAQAAERAGCAAHLGIVHIEESGSAQENYDPSPRRWGRYHDYDEDETEDASGDDFEIVEVCDWRHFVSQWRDLRDQPVAFGEIPLEPGELLPDGALDDEKPDEQRLMEASGNEGASFERSYHRAALVIWRRERYAEVLLQAGVAAVLPYLKEKIGDAGVSRGCDASSQPPARKEAVALARLLVKAWKGAPEYAGYDQPARSEKRDVMLSLLNQLGEVALLEEFIAGVVTRDYDGSDNAALVGSAAFLEAEITGRLYAELIGKHIAHLHGCCVDLLHELTFKSALAAGKAGRAALFQIAEAAVGKLDEAGKKRPENEWMDWRLTEQAHPVNAALVANLMNVLGELDAAKLRAAAVEKFSARPTVFEPVTVLVPSFDLIREPDAAVARLWNHCAEFLLQRSGHPPQTPTDWRQDVKLSCSCADCRELQKFTLDPAEQTHRFRVKKERRQHLHQQIEKHTLDMTHVTDRNGSPQTLVCTKDRRSYQRRCEQYRKDIAAFAQLVDLAEKSSAGNPGALKRIAAARALAKEWSPG
jgi:predicted 2-oxoglutarate/Fe(II)-dependent dioxygenase YbiX